MTERSITARLETARRLAGLSKRELERLAQLKTGHYTTIVSRSASNLETKTIEKLADVLGASLDWLIKGYGPAPSPKTAKAAAAAARQKAA